MTSLNLISPAMGAKYQGAADPLIDPSPLYSVGDKYTNTTTGEIFTCFDVGSYGVSWAGTQGTIYDARILDPNNANLIAYYTMDNISGATLVDESPNSNDGTISGTTAVAGKVGNALDFNATASEVSIPDSASMNFSNGFSLCGWVNRVSSATSDILFSKTVFSPSFSLTFYVQIDSTDQTLDFYLSSNGTSVTQSVSTTGYSVTGERFIVVTYDPSNKIEINIDNGANVFTNTSGIPATLSDPAIPVTLGRFGGNDSTRWRGWQDQVRFFNRPLTASEISILYNGGAGA